MDTSFASPQPSPGPLWHDIPTAISERPKSTFPLRRTISSVRTAALTEPSTWSISAAKRRLDVVVAGVALLILSPLLALAALMVRFRSPGPVIFRQKRVGQGGILFTVYKFRTMDVSAQDDGPLMTKRGDPRVTTFGRFLRKYKLDELPQLFNVLRGDMSLIGPRPRLPHHMDVMDMPFRPGLTGAATLAFRHEEELLEGIPDHELEDYNSRMIIPLKTQLDWDYMGQATPYSDLAMLYETAACCIWRRPNSWAIDLS